MQDYVNSKTRDSGVKEKLRYAQRLFGKVNNRELRISGGDH